MMKTPFAPVLLATVLAACLSGYGQDGGEARVELICLAWERPIVGLMYGPVDEPRTMDVYARGFSAPANYEGPAVLEFYRLLPPQEEGGVAVRHVVASVVLPEGASSVLLLFRDRQGTEEEGYHVSAIDNSLERFPAGSFRFFNFTNVDLLGVVGGEPLQVKAGAAAIQQPEGDENGNVEVRLYSEAVGQARAVYSSVWGVRNSRRTSVFILADPSSTRDLEIRKFVESITE